MPGFCFSPTMVGQTIYVVLKDNGTKISGTAIEANPTELVLKNPKNNNLIRINRDEVSAISGTDNQQRVPDPIRLQITRCYNMATKCNGVKRISVDPLIAKDYKTCCSSLNEFCEFKSMNFFNMGKHVQSKLLNNITIGNYPENKSKTPEEKEK